MPVAHLPLSLGAKLAGTVATGAVLLSIHAVVDGEKAERAGLWTLLALLASPAFVFRVSLLRPHLLAISLALWLTWLLARRRLRWVLLVSALYPLSYVAWHSALIIAVLVELARLICRQRPEWRTLAAVTGGLLTGLLIHPNFPEILTFFWVQNYEILVNTAWAGRAGFDLGPEFSAFDPLTLVLQFAIPLTLLGTGIWRGWQQRTVVEVAFTIIAAAFILITIRTERFIEYAAPFSITAAALWWRHTPLPQLPSLAGVVAMVLHAVIIPSYPLQQLQRRPDAFPPAMQAAVGGLIPAGSQVFTCSWQFTGEMMFALPDRRFMVALDPVLFFYKDPTRYERWFNVVRQPPPGVGAIIREEFGASYVLCETWPDWQPLLTALDAEPGVTPLLRTPLWNVYRVVP